MLTRGQPTADAPQMWQQARLAGWRERARKSGSGDQQLQVGPLPATRLPPAWRGIRIDVTERDGSHIVVVEAYSRRGPASAAVGWLARLDTAPERVKRLLPVFRRLLARLPASP